MEFFGDQKGYRLDDKEIDCKPLQFQCDSTWIAPVFFLDILHESTPVVCKYYKYYMLYKSREWYFQQCLRKRAERCFFEVGSA